jgi:hypothetical protein
LARKTVRSERFVDSIEDPTICINMERERHVKKQTPNENNMLFFPLKL